MPRNVESPSWHLLQSIPAAEGAVGDLHGSRMDVAATVSAINGYLNLLLLAKGVRGPTPPTSPLTDTLPPNVIFGSATPSQGSCSRATTVKCNLGGVSNGGSVAAGTERR